MINALITICKIHNKDFNNIKSIILNKNKNIIIFDTQISRRNNNILIDFLYFILLTCTLIIQYNYQLYLQLQILIKINIGCNITYPNNSLNIGLSYKGYY